MYQYLLKRRKYWPIIRMVLLEADVLELKANPHKQAKGAVIEARLDKSKEQLLQCLYKEEL